MLQVAIFAGATLRRNLTAAPRRDVAYAFFAPDARLPADALRGFDGALLELRSEAGAAQLKALREGLPGRPVGSLALRGTVAVLRRSARLGFDFHLDSW